MDNVAAGVAGVASVAERSRASRIRRKIRGGRASSAERRWLASYETRPRRRRARAEAPEAPEAPEPPEALEPPGPGEQGGEGPPPPAEDLDAPEALKGEPAEGEAPESGEVGFTAAEPDDDCPRCHAALRTCAGCGEQYLPVSVEQAAAIASGLTHAMASAMAGAAEYAAARRRGEAARFRIHHVPKGTLPPQVAIELGAAIRPYLQRAGATSPAVSALGVVLAMLGASAALAGAAHAPGGCDGCSASRS